MKHTNKISQVLGAGRAFVERINCDLSGIYYTRVTLPVQVWRARGCPKHSMPRMPWWQPTLFRYLVITGWRPVPERRSRYPRIPVYYLH